MEDSTQGGNAPFDLSELTGFQFGPAWAKPGADTAPSLPKTRTDERPERRGGPRRPNTDRRTPRRDESAPADRAPRKPGFRPGRDRRGNREETPRRELPQPADGFRVELRPTNGVLELFSKEIARQKRALPLLDLSRIVMAGKDRYDLVFMKLENGPMLIHSTKGDGACWLTEAEAVSYMWIAPWFAELYAEQEVTVEAPKGNFTAIATCTMGGEVIGPVNWHGYQAALMNLYRTKYANMPLEAFKNRITLNKDEEAVQNWLAGACKKTVWKPTREDAAELVLDDAKSVEADFVANYYGKVYETVDKVFINGATPRKLLSPGLAAHLAIMSDKTRRSPQMLIPNLCHGLARHHMPIYKWQGNHFTGPSRVRSIPADTVLADRMMAIVNWSKEHSGEKVEAMFAELSGVPAGTDEESRKAASDAYAPYAADMIWLLEQGFVVVTGDNSIWYPKGSAAPAPTKVEQPKRPRRK
ncbi:MAG: hypothetical protein IJB33_01785 [Akkermansia sp.]|nr:hypothetical protein [Akkermansia sp.]MBQ7024937.1 hypothetical protein [Akkermansia sp.]